MTERRLPPAAEQPRKEMKYLLAEALLDDHAALLSFFEGSPFPMGIAELEGDRSCLVAANQALVELLDLPPEQLAGHRCTDWIRPVGVQQVWAEACHSCLAEAAPVQFEFELDKGQGSLWLRGTASHIGSNPSAPPRFSFMIEDITERRRAKQHNLRQNTVLEAFGRVLSSAMACDSEDELGQICLEQAELVTDSKFGIICEFTKDRVFHSIRPGDAGWKEGSPWRTAGETGAPITFPGGGLYSRVMREGTSYFTNSPAADSDGIDYPEGLTAFLAVPLVHKGETVGMLGVANREGGYDEEVAASLTQLSTAVIQAFQRKRAADELRQARDELEARVAERTADLALTLAQLEAEFTERMATLEELHEKDRLLLQQSRLAAMGEMINNIAHQWRQPLNALGMRLQNLLLFYDAGRFDRDFVQRTRDEGMKLVHHMSQTIEDFRNFFRPNKEMSVFRVREALDKTISLTGDGFFSRNVAVRSSIRGEPQVYGYFNEFCQVLLNILQNSRDAFLERRIETGTVNIIAAEKNGRSVISIADNAGGIPEQHLHRVFEPYFSTKGLQGTGVGLYMSKNIIETNMGGRISVANTEEGAIFTIEL